MKQINRFATLFEPPPYQWGLRGDPFLWQDMDRLLRSSPFPATEDELITLVEGAFEKLTGARLPDKDVGSDGDAVYVERYAHGGMSSGQVCISFWRCSAIPLLLSRYRDSRTKIG